MLRIGWEFWCRVDLTKLEFRHRSPTGIMTCGVSLEQSWTRPSDSWNFWSYNAVFCPKFWFFFRYFSKNNSYLFTSFYICLHFFKFISNFPIKRTRLCCKICFYCTKYDKSSSTKSNIDSMRSILMVINPYVSGVALFFNIITSCFDFVHIFSFFLEKSIYVRTWVKRIIFHLRI